MKLCSTAAPNQRAIDPVLFHWPASAPALLAGRCRRCASVSFPASATCMAGGCADVAIEELPRRGMLWTWTIQHFMPKTPYHSSETPETFAPFGIGYIELPGALRIETRLLENDPQRLKIGSLMELAFYVHRREPDGTEVINYAFKTL